MAWFQAQVCGDVDNRFSACKMPSPINQLSMDKSKCMSLGEIGVSAWDPNPYDDGIYLTHYHGASLNNVQHISSRIYFICNDQPGEITFEHVRGCVDPADKLYYGGMYHFSINTPLVC